MKRNLFPFVYAAVTFVVNRTIMNELFAVAWGVLYLRFYKVSEYVHSRIDCSDPFFLKGSCLFAVDTIASLYLVKNSLEFSKWPISLKNSCEIKACNDIRSNNFVLCCPFKLFVVPKESTVLEVYFLGDTYFDGNYSDSYWFTIFTPLVPFLSSPEILRFWFRR